MERLLLARPARQLDLGVRSGDLSAVVDLTNATNRRNECCVVLEMEDASALEAEVDHWLPAIINIGFTYRWRSR